MALPLDRPRQRYGGDTRDINDDFEESEGSDDEMLSPDDEEADAVEIEGWDLEGEDEQDYDWGDAFEDDGDIWADYCAPSTKGGVGE